MVANWIQITVSALETAWKEIVLFLPKLIGGIIVALVGWILAELIGKIITQILRQLKVDRAFERTGWSEALEKAEIKFSPSVFFGQIVKWILFLVFLLAAVEILGFVAFSQFLAKIVGWLPNLIVAALIFIVAIVVADILSKIVRASVQKLGIAFAAFLEWIVKGSIYLFALFAILLQLGVAQEIVKAIVYGLVFAVSLALGLSFGLGGQQAAQKIIEEIKKKLEK